MYEKIELLVFALAGAASTIRIYWLRQHPVYWIPRES